LKNIIKAKDDIIWNLLQSKQTNPEIYAKVNSNKILDDVKHVSNLLFLNEKLAENLNKFNLVCRFCKGKLEDNINTECEMNNADSFDDKNNSKFKNKFTENVISLNNQKKHYFIPDINNHNYDNKINNKSKQIQRTEQLEIRNSYNINKSKLSSSLSFKDSDLLTSFKSHGYNWVLKIASVLDNRKINIYKVLKEYDFHKDGYISVNDLHQALRKLQINMNSSEIENMNKHLMIYENSYLSIQEFSKYFTSI
jgi:Ca2+-binding EF-hand superfamily protein